MSSSLRNIIKSISFFFLFFPALIGYLRDNALETVSKKLNVELIKPTSIEQSTCTQDICRQKYNFEPSKNRTHSAIGYHSAFSDSYLDARSEINPETVKRNEIKLSWYKFKTFSLTNNSSKEKISIVCVSPPGTKKLGMDNPTIFAGSRDAIDQLQFIYSLFNVHIYILCALIIIFLGALLFFSEIVKKNDSGSKVIIQAIIVASTLIAFSHLLDDIAISLSAPKTITEGFPRLFIGLIVSLFFIRKQKNKIAYSAIYLTLVVPGLVDWQLRDFFLHTIHRWTFSWATLSSIVLIISRRENWTYLPFAGFLLIDSLTMHNVLKLRSGLYLYPLTLPALFVLFNRNYFNRIIEHQKLWNKKREISLITAALRDTENTSISTLKNALEKICVAIAKITTAQKVSICYLELDSPVILTLREGSFTPAKDDGLLPPIFSRVIQTKEPLWWVGKDTLEKYIPRGVRPHTETYKTDCAAIIPILCGGEVYGAISLTEFSNISELIENEEIRDYTKSNILDLTDFISSQFIKKKNDYSNNIQEKVSELISKMTRNAAFSDSKDSTITYFLDSINIAAHQQILYFAYSQRDERLTLTHSRNLTPDQNIIWSNIPFRARAENKHSPFSIVINEVKSIFIKDIRSLFNILVEQSVSAFTATKSKTFLAVPIAIGDQVLGLICILDTTAKSFSVKELEKVLDFPTKCLAYQLLQEESERTVERQERILCKFADPQIAEMLLSETRENDEPIGSEITCAIVLQDLRGSSIASQKIGNPKDLATRLQRIYIRAGEIAKDYGGTVEKGNGDGIITAIPCSEDKNGNALTLSLRYLDEVQTAAAEALGIGDSIVIVHRGRAFRGVLGPSYRLAPDLCGVDLINVFSIEKHSKQINGIKLAVTSEFVSKETSPIQSLIRSAASELLYLDFINGPIYLFKDEGVISLRNFLSSRDNS